MTNQTQGSEAEETTLQKAVSIQRHAMAAVAKNGKVLVVEDETEILEPLAHSLHKAGFSVLRAEDGLTACRFIGSEQPDLILLDIMLPDLDGWEVCRLLRQHPDSLVASIPVVMLTALGAAEDKYRGLEIGADLFIPKPYSIREVILHAGNLVRRRQQALALEARVKALSNSNIQTPELHHLLFHELRNQLLILNGYTELLQKDPGSKRASICMDAIHRSSNYLQTLAEEVLLIRQVENGRMTLECEDFPIEPLVSDIIKVYKTPAQEKEMHLRSLFMTEQPRANLNRLAVKIILSALLDNSIKYGPAGQTVTLNCQSTETKMTLTVADEGPGISETEREKIFEAYYRIVELPGKPRGRGLGLYAVRVLARAMGGEVSVQSHNGQGSCFRVELPSGATESKLNVEA
jgi:two-component system sensor histidine kinase/response regulator